jgi:hypothetical protein
LGAAPPPLIALAGALRREIAAIVVTARTCLRRGSGAGIGAPNARRRTARDVGHHGAGPLWQPARHAEALPQIAELFAREGAEFPRTQAVRRDSGERRSREAHDRKTGRFAHLADLLVTAFVQRHFEPSFFLLVPQNEDLAGARLFAVDDDPFFPAQAIRLLHVPLHLQNVRLGDVALRVNEAVAKLAVVRQKEGAARVVVEPSHGKDPLRYRGQELAHRRASFRIMYRRDDAARLV